LQECIVQLIYGAVAVYVRKIAALHTELSQACGTSDDVIGADSTDDSVAVWCGTPLSILSQLRSELSKFAPEKLAQLQVLQLLHIVVVKSGLTSLVHASNLHHDARVKLSNYVMHGATPAKLMLAI
jgi:hypothetical protein